MARLTIPELIERIKGHIVARLPGANSEETRTLVEVLAIVEAECSNNQYEHQAHIERNLIPSPGNLDYVERWASLKSLSPLPAEFAGGNITFTGTNSTVVPEGTVVQHSSGQQYETLVEGAISGGSLVVAVEALVAGAAGNLPTSSVLTLVTPISGINSQATSGAITGGADPETPDALFERLVLELSQPSNGGSKNDYIRWARAAHPAVTRVWPVANQDEVTVFFVCDLEDDIIPTQGVIDAVQAYIDDDDIKPLVVEFFAVAPTPVALDLEINIAPDTQDVRDAITAELKDMLRREASPGGTILISKIREAISIAAGEDDHALVSPTANVEHEAGEIAVLGDITFGALP